VPIRQIAAVHVGPGLRARSSARVRAKSQVRARELGLTVWADVPTQGWYATDSAPAAPVPAEWREHRRSVGRPVACRPSGVEREDPPVDRRGSAGLYRALRSRRLPLRPPTSTREPDHGGPVPEALGIR
jgi:hypothetical protein